MPRLLKLPASTADELARVRRAAAAQLRRAGRRPTRAEVDAFVWRRWYALRDDVCERLGAIVEARASTARAFASSRGCAIVPMSPARVPARAGDDIASSHQ